MKAFVITIKGHKQSEAASDRFIQSVLKIHPKFVPEKFYGFTPKDNPEAILKQLGYPTKFFVEKYSRYHNAMAAYLSHRAIWEMCSKLNRSAFIFEHDALLVDSLPIKPNGNEMIAHPLLGDIVNLGQPSYGNFNTPPNMGINKLTSKQYFPGAHAYFVRPNGANKLLEVSKKRAGPTDTFINLNSFPNLQEWFPWCAIAKDSFTTIQNTNGCLAKHNFNKGYKIVKV